MAEKKKQPPKRKPGTLMDDILSAPGRITTWIRKRNQASTYGDTGGNPAHYGSHVKPQGQGRSKGGGRCHHGK